MSIVEIAELAVPVVIAAAVELLTHRTFVREEKESQQAVKDRTKWKTEIEVRNGQPNATPVEDPVTSDWRHRKDRALFLPGGATIPYVVGPWKRLLPSNIIPRVGYCLVAGITTWVITAYVGLIVVVGLGETPQFSTYEVFGPVFVLVAEVSALEALDLRRRMGRHFGTPETKG